MKKNIKTRICILSLFLGIAGVFTSCNDFLTLYPTGQITEEDFWQDKKDLDAGVYACYHQFASEDVISKIIRWGEARSDNFSVRDLSNQSLINLQQGILQATDGSFDWASFYKGINFCNTVLAHGEDVIERDPSFSSEDWKATKAEMISLRALYHFYLIRAFKDVPKEFSPVTTDAQAMKSFTQQTKALDLLSELITQVDSVKDEARVSYGNNVLEHGRLTRNSIYTLLADMYLWRGSMLKEPTSGAKKDTFNVAQSNSDFQRVVDLTTTVLNDLNKENSRRTSFVFSGLNEQHNATAWLVNSYPISSYFMPFNGMSLSVFTNLFNSGLSSESLFEIQYDGVKQSNAAVRNSFYSVASGDRRPGAFIGTSAMSFRPTRITENRGFGLTDLRYPATFMNEKANQTEYPIIKFSASQISVSNVKNVGELPKSEALQYNFPSSNDNSIGWIVYRVSDVMLMKAEAISRIAAKNSDELREGFNLVNAIFARANPAADSTGSDTKDADNIKTDRLKTTYPRDKEPGSLLTLVLEERQREFYGEGKRWFDMVRLAEANGTTKESLDLLGATRAQKTRLRLLDAFYNPVYNEQIKINEALVQNPVWNKEEDN